LPAYKAAFHLETNLPRHFAFLRNMVQNGLPDLSVTGTCFEYGMQEGILSEDMPADPANPYAQAKDALRKQLEYLQQTAAFDLKWIRLFYMYGKGQNSNSLLSQLQKALDEKAASFNMSGGEQVRDYLPVEKVAEYIVKIALQHTIKGIINCCSGQPVTVRQLVENYLKQTGSTIQLNLGIYPYTDYEPMAFWGDTKKLEGII
jgi:dTDP-6-deoxy-L-talose 4-dehydrogenase (NAD+)